MTATWARFAASATRVKSLRKLSVEGALIGAGGGGTKLLFMEGDCWVGETKELVWVAVDGDEMGASIVSLM